MIISYIQNTAAWIIYFGYPKLSFLISPKILWDIQKKTIILDIRKKCLQISEIVISDISRCFCVDCPQYSIRLQLLAICAQSVYFLHSTRFSVT